MAINIPMDTLEKIVYKSEELAEFSVDGCEWRKPYTLEIPTVTGINSVTVTRYSTESNCQTEIYPNAFTSDGTVLHGDYISASVVATTGYVPSVSFSSGVAADGRVTGQPVLDISAVPDMCKISFGSLAYGVWRVNTTDDYTGYVPYNSTWSISNYFSSDLRNQMVLTIKDPSGNTLVTADFMRTEHDLIDVYFDTAITGLNGYETHRNGYPISGSSMWYLYKNNYRFSIDETDASGYITADKKFTATVTQEPATLKYSVEGTDGYASTTGFRTLKISGYVKDVQSSDQDNMMGLLEQYIFTENHSASDFYDFDTSAFGTSSMPTTLTADTTTITPVVKQYMRFYTVTFATSPAGYGTTVYGVDNTTSLIVPYGTTISTDGDRLALVVDTSNYPNAINNTIGGVIGTTPTEAIVTGKPLADDDSYSYAFSSWSDTSGTITANKTITANFTRTALCTITIENPNYGEVYLRTLDTMVAGDLLSNGSKVKSGRYLIIRPASATGYTYSVTSSTGTITTYNGEKIMQVDGNETITFSRTEHEYEMTYVSMPTGVASFIIYKNGSAVVTNPTSTSGIKVKYSDKLYATATAATGYGTPTINGISTSSSSPTTNITANFTVSVTAGSSTSADITIDVTFPAVARGSAYTVMQTDEGYYYESSAITTYEGYSYPTCVIDGITVGSTYTQISQTSLLNTITRSASFSNGVLRVRTTVGTTQETNTIEPIMAAGTYSTTATFSS